MFYLDKYLYLVDAIVLTMKLNLIVFDMHM